MKGLTHNMKSMSLMEGNTNNSNSTCINYVTEGKSSFFHCAVASKQDAHDLKRKIADCTTINYCHDNSIISPKCTYTTLITSQYDDLATSNSVSSLILSETPNVLMLDTKNFSSNSTSPSSLTSSKSENNIFEGNLQQPYSIFDVVSLNDVNDVAGAFTNSYAMGDLSKNRVLNVQDRDMDVDGVVVSNAE
jgi:hypothetical protein